MRKLIALLSLLIFIGAGISAQTASPEKKTTTVTYCKAVTKTGTQCSRKATAGQEYCSQHLAILNKATTAVPDTTKYYTGPKGGKYYIKNGTKHYVKSTVSSPPVTNNSK